MQTCEYSQWRAPQLGGPERLLRDKVRQYSLTQKPCTTILPLGDYSVLRVDAPDVPELVLRNITAQLPEDEHGVAMIYLERDRGCWY